MSNLRQEDIRDHWGWVAPAIRSMGDEIPLEAVLRECIEDRAHFLMGEGREFVILKGCSRSWTDEEYLLVWCAWSKNGNAINKHWAEICEIGRRAGFRTLEFWTKRKGFERLAKRLGVEPEITIYRGEI